MNNRARTLVWEMMLAEKALVISASQRSLPFGFHTETVEALISVEQKDIYC